MSFAGKEPFISGVGGFIRRATLSVIGRAGAKMAAASLSLFGIVSRRQRTRAA